jgi:O-antigen/teichoic acid export membrane protein
MALLALGYYSMPHLDTTDTLRIYGRLRYTVVIDFVSVLINLGLSLLLIPRFGALGAAVATSGTLIVYNILNHIGLKFATPINLLQWRSLRVYASAILGTLVLTILQTWLSLPIYLGVILAGLISLFVLLFNRDVLKIEQTFPELLRAGSYDLYSKLSRVQLAE